MTSESLRQALQAQPFVPFVLRLTDGRSFEVNHPEFVLAPKNARIVILYLESDRYMMIDLLMVSSLDFDRRQRHRGNGRRKAG